MKKIFILSFVFLIGAINLSASKEEKLIGKWQAYKMVRDGKTRNISEEKKVPWIDFQKDNLLWAGEGKKDKERGEWWLDEDKKIIHLILKNRDRQMTIQRLSKKKLVLQFKEGVNATFVYWENVS